MVPRARRVETRNGLPDLRGACNGLPTAVLGPPSLPGKAASWVWLATCSSFRIAVSALGLARGSWLPSSGASRPPSGAASLVVIAEPPRPYVPWDTLRRLLARLSRRPRQSDAPGVGWGGAIDGPLGLVLRRGAPANPAAAQAPGFLSHHPLLQWPLTNAWVEVLAPLAAGRDIVLQHASSIDPMELRVLRRLVRRTPRMTLLLRDEPDFVATESGRRTLPPRDDRLEVRAHESLASGAPDVRLVLRALEASWACFGFAACEWLGEELLRQASPLSQDDRRRVHLLVAMSMHNRGAGGVGVEAEGARLGRLEGHLRAALVGEVDLCKRSHLCYRLALVIGQGAAELSAAAELADEAIHLAAAAGDALFEAWALHGKARLIGRTGALDEAFRLSRRAFDLATMPAWGAIEIERPLTQVVIADHLAELAQRAGEAGDALSWQARAESLGEAMGVPYVPSFRWIEIHRARGDLDSGARVAERAIAAARDLPAPADEVLFAMELGDLSYRRGLPKLARRAFLRAQAVSERWGLGPAPPASSWGAAVSALRAGRHDDARHDLEQALAGRRRLRERVQVLGLLGQVAARAGDEVSARLRVGEAIALATDAAQRDVLLCAELAAGETSLALGRPRDAEAAFRRATALAEGEPPASPAARVAALGGLLAAGGGDIEVLRRALGLLERALSDAETWWQLGRLHDAARRFATGADHPVLAAALAQRCDARGDEPSVSRAGSGAP